MLTKRVCQAKPDISSAVAMRKKDFSDSNLIFSRSHNSLLPMNESKDVASLPERSHIRQFTSC
jgi:hypothetical protein